jgi:hypothetical protein
MKAGIKVSNRKDKERIERALSDERILNFVRTMGDIKAITIPGLLDHAMKHYGSILAETGDPGNPGSGEAQKPA